MSGSLSGCVAVVTGAARGIGDAIAERLLADGARVFSLDKAAPTAPRDGVVYLEADVTDPASVAAAFTAIDAASGRLDILVNNAGIQRIGLVGKVSFVDWSAVIATQLNGFFLCAERTAWLPPLPGSFRPLQALPSPQLAPPASLSQRKSSPSAVKVALSLLSLP